MNFDSKEVKREAAPTLFIELADQRDSGYVLDGTIGTKHETRLTCPKSRFIPSRGFRLVEGKNPETGKDEWYNEEIRYIKNQRVLSVVQQQSKGIKPSRMALEDKIRIDGGNFSVTREGAFIGLYDYLMDVFYNGSNKNRPASATVIFKVKEVGKAEEEFNENEIAYSDAIQFLKTLYRREGKGFVYDEGKINALAGMFVMYAETPAGKISGLMGFAKKDPVSFLQKAMKFEQTVITEIAYAVELNVIKFDGNTAVYCNKDKVIADLGRGNLKAETKMSKLADLFNTAEHKDAYEEFRIELQTAMENQTK